MLLFYHSSFTCIPLCILSLPFVYVSICLSIYFHPLLSSNLFINFFTCLSIQSTISIFVCLGVCFNPSHFHDCFPSFRNFSHTASTSFLHPPLSVFNFHQPFIYFLLSFQLPWHMSFLLFFTPRSHTIPSLPLHSPFIFLLSYCN